MTLSPVYEFKADLEAGSADQLNQLTQLIRGSADPDHGEVRPLKASLALADQRVLGIFPQG